MEREQLCRVLAVSMGNAGFGVLGEKIAEYIKENPEAGLCALSGALHGLGIGLQLVLGSTADDLRKQGESVLQMYEGAQLVAKAVMGDAT